MGMDGHGRGQSGLVAWALGLVENAVGLFVTYIILISLYDITLQSVVMPTSMPASMPASPKKG